MQTKKVTVKLLDKYKNRMIANLGLKKWKIVFHVCSSKSNYLKHRGVSKATRTNKYGLSFISPANKTADVVLFFDAMGSQKDVVCTLFHELLHVALSPLLDLITIKMEKAGRLEEDLVSRLEGIFRANVREQ